MCNGIHCKYRFYTAAVLNKILHFLIHSKNAAFHCSIQYYTQSGYMHTLHQKRLQHHLWTHHIILLRHRITSNQGHTHTHCTPASRSRDRDFNLGLDTNYPDLGFMTFLSRFRQMQRYHLNLAMTTVNHILPTSYPTSHPFTYNINITRHDLQAIPDLDETVYPWGNFSHTEFIYKNQHL